MNDDATLFDIFYTDHRRVVYAYLLGNVGDREAAADLLQETFLRVWRHIEEARRIPTDRRRFWLFAIARNQFLDYHRRQAVRARLECIRSETASQVSQDPVQKVITAEAAFAIDEAIRRLPQELREVLTLTVMAEMNSVEIGKLLERPASTVRWQLARARSWIANEIEMNAREKE